MKSLLDKVNAKLNAEGGFLKSISLLVGGTVFAHAITILALPLITRLYSPEDFSRLAIYTSLLGIFSVVACLRYEVAIPLPQSDDEAERLLIISIINSLLFSLILFLLLFFLNPIIIQWFGNRYFSQITWLLPLGVLSASLYSAFKFWCTRTRDFKVIAKTKFEQALSSVIAQLGLGWLGMTSIGMLVGQFFYNGAGFFSLLRKKSKFTNPNYKNIKQTYKNYSNYPKYSVAEALFNTAGVHLPMLLIAIIAAPKEAGYLLLASKIMVIPMVLIGTSVSQVYYAHANEAKNKGELAKFTRNCMLKLFKLGAVPLIVIGLVAPWGFALIFGNEWKRAGELVAWMTPWFLLQFLASPVSLVLHICMRQKLALVLQFVGFVLRVGSIFLAIIVAKDLVSEFYAISGFIFYLIYLVLILKILKNIEKC
ncbi:lipopolysaccharide biosynthesis protein [Acinetobacter johnsonii]|uniref:lipopolysaccharide biosynthesis protein n=1 Tax=Acinetobacter johnsonii TaxID=40214 RepID=UPI0024480CB8|nr:oligosaccharide flippase family protein [Acinetobacter johnsonii]MDH1706344.1 oligosaccharide flippase family protein [Acinetobacter johnsonii]